jgi:hypothetical protein
LVWAHLAPPVAVEVDARQAVGAGDLLLDLVGAFLVHEVFDLGPCRRRCDEHGNLRRLRQRGGRGFEVERFGGREVEELPQAHFGDRHLALPAGDLRVDGGERGESA